MRVKSLKMGKRKSTKFSEIDLAKVQFCGLANQAFGAFTTTSNGTGLKCFTPHLLRVSTGGIYSGLAEKPDGRLKSGAIFERVMEDDDHEIYKKAQVEIQESEIAFIIFSSDDAECFWKVNLVLQDESQETKLSRVVELQRQEIAKMKKKLAQLEMSIQCSWTPHRKTYNETHQEVTARGKETHYHVKLKTKMKSYFKVRNIRTTGGGNYSIVGVSGEKEGVGHYIGQTSESIGWQLDEGILFNGVMKVKTNARLSSGNVVCVRIDRKRGFIQWEIERNGECIIVSKLEDIQIPDPAFPAVQPLNPGDSFRLIEMDGVSFSS